MSRDVPLDGARCYDSWAGEVSLSFWMSHPAFVVPIRRAYSRLPLFQ